MSNRALTYHLVITINNEDYILGSLSIKQHKNEMSYLLHFPKDALNEPLNINLNKKTSRLKHITWHKDRVHIKLLDGTYRSIKYEPFLPSQKIIKPIFVESFYADAMRLPLMIRSCEFPSWREGRKVRILALNASLNFSIFFGLLPNDWQLDGVYLTSSESPELLFSLGQLYFSILRIQNALGSWDLLVCTSPYVSGGKYEHPNMTSPQRKLDHLSPGSSVNLIIKNIFISMLVRMCNEILLLKKRAMS
jgi:hypothetical protein